jgi:hypothetical protein
VEVQASRVNIAPLQMRPCLQAQTASLERGEAAAGARQLHAGEDGTHLRGAQDDRELLLPGRPNACPGCPFALPGGCGETREAAQGDGTGTTGVVRDVLEREEVGPEFVLRDAVGGLVVMVRPLPDGPDLHLLGPFGQASALQICNHLLAP